MGNKSGPEGAKTIDSSKESTNALAQYRESAEKNPEAHMKNLLQQAVSYLVNSGREYQARKVRFDDAMKKHKEDPAHNKKPYVDPFVVNYEAARDQMADMLSGTGVNPADLPKLWQENRLDEIAEKLVAAQAPVKVKALANQVWIRTIFPNRPMISNLVKDGARYMMFERVGSETADARVTVWPSGTVEVTVNGHKVDNPIVPPFPDIFLTHA